MPVRLTLRLLTFSGVVDLAGTLLGVGDEAERAWQQAAERGALAVLLRGDRDYAAELDALDAESMDLLQRRQGGTVFLRFQGQGTVRRRLMKISVPGAQPVTPTTPTTPTAPTTPTQPAGGALDLTEGRAGAAPLWLLADGSFSLDSSANHETAARGQALINAARWISTRRKTTFECLFAPSAFHPDLPVRPERLSASQAEGTLAQVRSALAEAAVGGDLAHTDALAAAQIRSAGATVLSHIVATALRDPSFRAVADKAAAALLGLVQAERDDATARPALRAHVIGLLQMRAPALNSRDRDSARALVQGLVRAAPPYAQLTGGLNFAMASADEFHQGECGILTGKYRFKEISAPPDAPRPPRMWQSYKVFEAPFQTSSGRPIRVYARSASPLDENYEMGQEFFHGLLINRHAQLGSFDMRAATIRVDQRGYKVLMNSQCAGLTTRFAIGRMFPDADIYSSWDSTYFRNDPAGHEVIASEGMDCFIALLQGIAHQESHAEIERRMRAAQWHHPQASAVADFSQFVGPSNPLVVARYSDVNQDGRADFYDGFLDFDLAAIAEDLRTGMTPRDPGVSASQISGEAANGLGWAAGSMNRVTQYSDLWSGMPGESEDLYAFQAGGFYSHREPPGDVSASSTDARQLGRLPAVVRYQRGERAGELSAEVMFHSWLSQAPKELKRLLVAADAMDRALGAGVLASDGGLGTPQGRRGAILLTLAGLLEFPADQNQIDAMWSAALGALGFPEISRSTVRACITDEDHDASNYYGSRRGLAQLLESLQRGDALVWAKMSGVDPAVGRAAEIRL